MDFHVHHMKRAIRDPEPDLPEVIFYISQKQFVMICPEIHPFVPEKSPPAIRDSRDRYRFGRTGDEKQKQAANKKKEIFHNTGFRIPAKLTSLYSLNTTPRGELK